MNGGAKRVGTLTAARAAELPESGPLKFDFSTTQPVPPLRPEKAATIKEALLRWLDEQL